MGVMSPRMLFLCSVVVILVAIHIHQSEAWRRRRWRAPRFRAPRIRLPSVRRIRLPSVRLIRLPSLRRIRLPSVRRIRFPRIRVRLPRIRRIRLPRLPRIRLRKPCVRAFPIRISRSCAKVTTKWPTPISTPTTISTTTSTTTSTPNDPCTVIQSRAQWGAPALTPSGPFLVTPVETVAVYVAGGVDCDTSLACIQQAKGQHTQVKNFNFLIGGDGTVLEGRGWNNVSDHIRRYNILELGVAFLAKCEPTDAAFGALETLIECGIGVGKLGVFQDDTLVWRYAGC